MLHLVGVLFPHIKEDARSKPRQIQIDKFGIEENEGKCKKSRDAGKDGNHGNIINTVTRQKQPNSVTKVRK